jgi:signal recognition particle subunit SRP19
MIWVQLILVLVIIVITQLKLFSLVSKGDNKIVLWPEYFDNSLTKNLGRRVPKKLASSSPTVEDIAKAAKRLKLKPKIERSKSYPSRWWKPSGRVLVSSSEPKTKIIRRVALVMKKGKK